MKVVCASGAHIPVRMLRSEERVIGFVHIGSFAGDDFERQRPDPAAVVSDYAGPAD